MSRSSTFSITDLLEEDNEKILLSVRSIRKKRLVEIVLSKNNIVNKINLGINWARDFKSESMTNVEVSEEHKKPLLEIITLLEKNSDPEVIQSEIFEIAKSNDMKPRALFQLIYQILLGSNKGPRLGKYIIDADKSTITKKIKAAIE